MIHWEGQDYFDDCLFLLDLRQAVKDGKPLWVVVTVRNVHGFPPRRCDEFETIEEATSFIEGLEPETPRISLGGQSPDPVPDFLDYVQWCRDEGIPTAWDFYLLNREGRPVLEIA